MFTIVETLVKGFPKGWNEVQNAYIYMETLKYRYNFRNKGNSGFRFLCEAISTLSNRGNGSDLQWIDVLTSP